MTTYKAFREGFLDKLKNEFLLETGKLYQYRDFRFKNGKCSNSTIKAILGIGDVQYFDYKYRRQHLIEFISNSGVDSYIYGEFIKAVKDVYFDYHYFNWEPFFASQFDWLYNTNFKVIVVKNIWSKNKHTEETETTIYKAVESVEMRIINTSKGFPKVVWEKVRFKNEKSGHEFISPLDYDSYINGLFTLIEEGDKPDIRIEDIPF